MAIPIAQTFFIDVPANIEGVFLTKLDLFFKRKDLTRGVTVELRAVDKVANEIMDVILPYSSVYLPNASINISTNGTAATTITFAAPVFVRNQCEYAFVVMPEANSPYVDLFCAKLGETDLLTGKRVSEQPYTGVLFISSNGRTWSDVQDEDIKFRLYRSVFSTTAGTVKLNNDTIDFFTIENPTGWGQMGETIHGENRLVLSSISGTISNSHVIVGNSSDAEGTITNISGSTYRVKGVLPKVQFTVGEALQMRYANGTVTGATAVLSSKTIPSGTVIFRHASDLDTMQLHLKETTGNFVVGEELRGQSSNTYCTIVSIDDLPMNVMDVEIQKMDFGLTSSTWMAKTTTESNAMSGLTSFNLNDNTEFSSERKVASKTSEVSNLSSQKSLQIQGVLKTYSNYLSPIVNTNRSHAVIVSNIINNDSTDEDQASGGEALARHITQKITLADGQDAEDLKMYITAFRPSTSNIKAYYRVLNSEDSDEFEDITWKEMQLASKLVYSLASNKDDFREYEFGIPEAQLTGSNGEVQYINSVGTTFTGFKYFQFKIVLLSTNTSIVPRLKDMRAMALQL